MTIGSVSNLNSWLAQLAATNSTSSTTSTQSDVTGSSDVSADAPPPPPPPSGGGLMSSILEALSQIGATSDSTSSASASSGTSSTNTSSTATSDPTLSNLQTSFNNLVAALGGSTDSSQTTVSNFLGTLASDMQGASPIGNLLSTQA